MERQEITRRLEAGFGRLGEGGVADLDMDYPGELPAELEPWHLWLPDAGHSIVVAMAERMTGGDWEEFLIPAPVKTVLRLGWELREGYVAVSGLHYDEQLGLRTPPEEDELSPAPSWTYRSLPRLTRRLYDLESSPQTWDYTVEALGPWDGQGRRWKVRVEARPGPAS